PTGDLTYFGRRHAQQRQLQLNQPETTSIQALDGAELVSARLDALKVGLSVAVGSGGVVALYLSWRRQHSAEADLDNRERALAHQQHDAAERRLTELYLKAVEQLGSPQAPVRHGGLYALERVAQDNPRQQQTVVNVICAYLRNPYLPPPETSGPGPLGIRRPLLRSATIRRTSLSPPDRGHGHSREAQLQEREVRITAQRILRLHLSPGKNLDHPQRGFWSKIDIDLTGATLINFSLSGCEVAAANFKGATFSGFAMLDGATFTNDVGFSEATFTDGVSFSQATFKDDVVFIMATFTGTAWFDRTTFMGGVWLDRAIFTGHARFDDATFTSHVGCKGTIFTTYASFDGATSNGLAFNPFPS
ncbi:pentapeptide repeat-containing protein, partial [Amycolatopsis mediterranei]|uniref:pentapeptide repeat-containing protein n=1 Tax=Amycolatopsis mediterranei TaxID=33910 RepID=UPI0034301D25